MSSPEVASSPFDKFVGRWTLKMDTPMGEMTQTLTLTRSSEGLEGTMSSEDEDLVLSNLLVAVNNLKWETALKKPMPLPLRFNVKVDGDQMSGEFKPGMFPAGKVTGVRET